MIAGIFSMVKTMNKLIKIILLTIVIGLSVNFIFGQITPNQQATTNDDSDGDGVKNADDACPTEKGTIANKGCPGKDDKTPATIEYKNLLLTESDRKALADCQYVLEDTGCAKFVGKTLSEIQAIFGKSDSYGDYYRLGIHFWYFNDVKLEEITFQGVISDKNYSPFVGQPGKKINWNATTEETIAQYGTPNEQSELYDYKYLKYGNVVFTFKFNKLVSAVIKDFDAKKIREATTAGNERQIPKTTQEDEKENAKRQAEQMESDYNELLNQLDAKIREGMRIVNSEKMAIAAGGMFKKAVQNKIDKVTAAGDSLIKSFGEKYKGKIPAWMVKGIQEKWRPIQ